MVLNICNSRNTLKAYSNGGSQNSDQVADLPCFFTVWFNPSSMINILSWADVSRKFCITADTNLGKYITVNLTPQRKMVFEEVASGLYLFRNRALTVNNNKINGYSYLMLTEANMANLTKQQIHGTERARSLYRSLGFPGYNKFLWLLNGIKLRTVKCHTKMQKEHCTFPVKNQPPSKVKPQGSNKARSNV